MDFRTFLGRLLVQPNRKNDNTTTQRTTKRLRETTTTKRYSVHSPNLSSVTLVPTSSSNAIAIDFFPLVNNYRHHFLNKKRCDALVPRSHIQLWDKASIVLMQSPQRETWKPQFLRTLTVHLLVAHVCCSAICSCKIKPTKTITTITKHTPPQTLLEGRRVGRSPQNKPSTFLTYPD